MLRFMTSAATIAILLATPVAAQSTAKTFINPAELPDAAQFGYSQVTITPKPTRLVHVAGQVGFSEGVENNFESQVDRAFANLGTALKAAGAGFGDVLKITILIVDHDQRKLDYLISKRKAVFGAAPPASTLIPVPKLYASGVTFEIDATATVPVSGD